MRLRDFRPWSAGSTVCLVLLGFTAGICLAQVPQSEQPAAKADAEEAKGEDTEARRVRHRRRLAEPVPPPKRLSVREERAMLRALLDLPPSERG